MSKAQSCVRLSADGCGSLPPCVCVCGGRPVQLASLHLCVACTSVKRDDLRIKFMTSLHFVNGVLEEEGFRMG